ncbi:GntR family transcriptional regulator [Reyranella soli]|uniref:GntR family transcriptional regulator n=1 Tax=Reyranella soli TaxID=1230389 RepID=A0A512NLW1_9HYPH|nr:GntR family transcriptional regulator [Reyranella soli]GEP59938.1 GntR family transcriptional regulator [Reyranella soli]
MDGASSPEIPLGRLVKPLSERLAERILEDVMAGRLAPGERLKEELLAQTHAVSRATVREALIALARQGYVVRIPRFGARIAELSRHDLDDLFELRAALLGLAAGRFARRAEAADGQMLEAMVAELEASANDERVSPQAFANQSIRLQTLLTDRCGNGHLPDIYKRLAGMGTWQLIRGQASSFLTMPGRLESAADWRRVADCIAAHDIDGAERAGRALLEHSAARVRQHYRDAAREST